MWLCLLLLLAGAAALPQATPAQNAEAVAGSISGRVLDAESGAPLPGAQVLLEPLAVNGARGPQRERPARSATTDALGAYAFVALRPGRYRVMIQRLGYESRQMEVDLVNGASAQVSQALRPQSVPLDELEVVGAATPPFARTEAPNASVRGVRRHVAQVRQRRFLVSDARELTQADVAEAITLGETDLLRALQRVPGVTTRDDYTAVLWTRGAPWDQTRIYFDGLPLYNPTHTAWLFSAINPDGIGEAVFLPGVRPAAWGEGAAGVLDLRSRSGRTADDAVRGAAEVSLFSARLRAEGSLFDGRVGWMIAGRRTYVDLVRGVLSLLDSVQDRRIPYNFSDVIGRVDAQLPGGWELEASTIQEHDRLRGNLPNLVVGNRAGWGNRSGQVTLRRELARGTELRLSGGRTLFGTQIHDTDAPDEALRADVGALRRDTRKLPALENTIRHDRVELALRRDRGTRWGWELGAGWMQDTVAYRGPYSLLAELVARARSDSLLFEPLTSSAGLRYAALWSDVRWTPTPPLTLHFGGRVESGRPVLNGGRTRFAPRFSAQYRADSLLTLTAGWGQSYQYTQTISSIGSFGPALPIGSLWALARRQTQGGYPALRSRIATLGAERWAGDDWLLTASLYARRSDGITIPDPSPGIIVPVKVFLRKEFQVARSRASGFELGARKLGGRWTAAAGYAYGVATMHIDSAAVSFPAETDVRHAVDATLATRLGPRWRLGGAFTFASGVPYTRMILTDRVWLDRPNAQRGPTYASLDGLLEYTTRWRGLELTGSLQVRNLMGRNNAVTYGGTEGAVACNPDPVSGEDCSVFPGRDLFETGLPRLPLLGVRVKF